MKKFILIIFSFLFIGCGSRYYYSTQTVVPADKQKEYADFVERTVKAATEHLTTSDYEDVDDTIDTAQNVGLRIYGVEVEGLQYYSDGGLSSFIPSEDYSRFIEQNCEYIKGL